MSNASDRLSQFCRTGCRGSFHGIDSDINAVLAELDATHLELDDVKQVMTEFIDSAICKCEGAAHSLRKLAGYVDGPYPPLERTKSY